MKTRFHPVTKSGLWLAAVLAFVRVQGSDSAASPEIPAPPAKSPGSQPSPDIFIHPAPLAPIYHGRWIDLNKNGVMDPYEDPSLGVEARITDLLARMSIEEKTAQMATLYGYRRVLSDELPTASWRKALWKDGIGNIDEHMNGHRGMPTHYAVPGSSHARALNEVQRFFVEDTRLGIPVDFTNEGIRGLKHPNVTSFPCELGVACAWDRELVHEIGRVTAREARALGYTNVYSPVLDLARDPRWGRTPGTYGEDPYLAAALGMQQVRGIQSEGVVSTLKHFGVYSVPKGGRDGEARTDPQLTWREVQTIYFEPFRRAVGDAGALGVMASYNDYDGIPVEGNRLFLTDILRQEWGFKGYVVSDSGAVEYIHRKHRVAPTEADAIRQAVEAGLNVRTNFTPPETYVEPLRQLVREGQISEQTIDARVRDILRVKYWLGLFDHPYVMDPAMTDRTVRAPEHLAVAARAARESIVLLKNEGSLLPLCKERLRTVLVAGPLADDHKAWQSTDCPQQIQFVSVLDALRKKLGPQVEIRYAKGCDVVDAGFPGSDVLKMPPSADTRAEIARAAAEAKGADVAIVVVGENDSICREAASRISLNLPGYQEELVQAIQETGTPVVLVLASGRPLSINWEAAHVPAILEMWFQGELAGDAMADVLLGEYNPAGRLPITFPRSVGQIPLNFPAHPGSQAHDSGQVYGPLFPFGFGLSYTTFVYSDLKIDPPRQGPQGRIEVSCNVTNTGDRAGDEVVELYLRDDYSSAITFEMVLRGFARIHLAPKETRAVHFTLTPQDLQLYDRNNRWTVEPGRFTVMIGASSENIRLRGAFTITRPDGSAPDEAPLKEKAAHVDLGLP